MEQQKPALHKPNIVLILADDMGFSDIGCFGSEIATPHLDSLAASDIRFTQAYNYARCCPSRAALLTGLHPHQAGVGHMVEGGPTPAYQGYLNDRCVTLAEALKTAGYRTMLCGKWHVGGVYPRNDPTRWQVGDPRRPLPLDRGFDEWYGTPAGAGSYFNPKPLFRGRSVIEPETDDYYYTDAVSEEAAAMVARAAAGDQPFFLHVCYTAPHWPLHAPAEEVARHQGRYRSGWDAVRAARHEQLQALGLIDRRWRISPRDPRAPAWAGVTHREWEDRRMAVYAAQISRMDRGIGRIMAAVRDQGVEHNTLVIFLSDNGGCAELLHEDGRQADREWRTTRNGQPVTFGNLPGLMPGGADTYQSYDLPWANASNTPFRLYKHWVHEGGIATPMVACWPGVTPKGSINHSAVHITDFMATFLEVADASYPDEYDSRTILPTEGVSFLAALRGAPWEREAPLFWEHEGNRAVRLGAWKLVSQHPDAWELYNLDEDRTELNNLADRDPVRARALAKLYEAWSARCDVLPWDELLARRSRVNVDRSRA